MNDDRELEALLRRALHEHAEKIIPGGDGLAKIQQRAANRRRRLVWLRPGMAVAAAAVAVIAAIAIPTAIHRMNSGNSGIQAGSRPSASSVVHGSTSVRPTPTPEVTAARQLKQVAMSWPYSSKAVAARSADQSLQSPVQLAKTFVSSFAGTDIGKTLNAQQQGTVVYLRRGSMLVSTVKLARIDKSSYVVTGARGTNVQLSTSDLTRTDTSIMVSGTFVPDNQATNIWAAAATPPDVAKAAPLTNATGEATSPWQVTLNARGTIAAGPEILAAWTVNTGGQLLDFTAIAAN